jgi:hypothetical protein
VSNVFTDQFYALSPTSELPCLIVYTPEEDTGTPPPRCHPGEEIRRVITLIVEGVVTGTVNLSDQLDQIAKEVEAKMATDFTLAGTCKSALLTRTATTLKGGDSPQPLGSIQMTWQVVTTTLEGVPDVVT